MSWNKFRHFRRSEAWGDPDRMNIGFVYELDQFRDAVRKRFVVTRGFATTGHATDSYHYKGRAVDGRFVDEDGVSLSLAEHIAICMQAPFNGIGIYTYSPNGTFVHFDNRLSQFRRVIWVCNEPGVYRPITESFVKQAI